MPLITEDNENCQPTNIFSEQQSGQQESVLDKSYHLLGSKEKFEQHRRSNIPVRTYTESSQDTQKTYQSLFTGKLITSHASFANVTKHNKIKSGKTKQLPRDKTKQVKTYSKGKLISDLQNQVMSARTENSREEKSMREAKMTHTQKEDSWTTRSANLAHRL